MAVAVVALGAALLACGHRISAPSEHVASPRGTCPMTYPADDCQSDGDCPQGTDCVCDFYLGGAGSPGTQNVCRPSNCRVDADCGVRGACSPSYLVHCSMPVVTGYFCHGANDECGVDGDCDGAQRCVYATELGHWVCADGTASCGGG